MDDAIDLAFASFLGEKIDERSYYFAIQALLLATVAPDEALLTWGGMDGLLEQLDILWSEAPPPSKRSFGWEQALLVGAGRLIEMGRADTALLILSRVEKNLPLADLGRLWLVEPMLRCDVVLGRFDEALDRIQSKREEWLALAERIETQFDSDSRSMAYALSTLFVRVGDTFLRLGLLDEDEQWAARALDLAELSGDLTARGNAALHLKDFYLVLGDSNEALGVLEELRAQPDYVRETSKNPRLKALRNQVELGRGVAMSRLEIQGQREGNESITILEQLLATTASDLLRTKIQRFLLDRLAMETSASAIQSGQRLVAELRAHAYGHDLSAEIEGAVACARFERRTKTGSLEDRVSQLESLLSRSLRAWSEIAPRPGGLGYLHLASRRRLIAETIQALTAQDKQAGPLRVLQLLMRVDVAGSLARRKRLQPLETKALVHALERDGWGLLYFIESLDEVLVCVVDSSGPAIIALPSKWTVQLERLAWLSELYRDPIGNQAERDRRAAHLRRGAEHVAQWLLPAALRQRIASWKGLLVQASAMAEDPALEALPWTLGDDRLLGETHAVEQTPSVALWYALDEKQRSNLPLAQPQAIVLGTLAPTPGRRIPGAVPKAESFSRSMDKLKESLSWSKTQVFAGDEANWGNLRPAINSLKHIAILHFLVHGEYSRERERGACLLLAATEGQEDGALFAEDIEPVPMPIDLVVLSACGAARGNLRIGDSASSHLGGAFLGAGVRGVVLSRANLELNSTVELFSSFQVFLGEGLTPASALRRARSSVSAWGDELARFHAARVVLIGTGRVPLVAKH